MAFCSKCGYELREGDVFCAKCGWSLAEGEKLLGLEFDSVQMTPEESVELADKLSVEYENLRLIKEEISNCESDIRKNAPSEKPPRYSAFRFFWPFLIAAMVTFWVIFFIGCIIVMYASWEVDDIYGAEIAGLVVAAIVLAVGGTIASNKRDSLNTGLLNEERYKSKKEHDLKLKLDGLKRKQIEMKKGVQEYNSLVPAALRNKATMNKVKMYIQNGQANTFSEAIKLCVQRF